jgi:large conductance mechanosensitive channel
MPKKIIEKKKTLIDEFKAFAIKGNAVDLAVGVIIGAAFGKIVTSLVSDIIMPPLTIITGGIDFSTYQLILKQGVDEASTITLNYGMFFQNIFDFLIVAAAIFFAIKYMNKLQRAEESKPEKEKVTTPSEEVLLLREIRDSLKK